MATKKFQDLGIEIEEAESGLTAAEIEEITKGAE